MLKYFPSWEHITQEVIATGIAVVLVAYIVSKSPTLKALVKSYDS